MDTVGDVSTDTEEIEELLEPLLSALRRRDGEELHHLAQDSALKARNARAQFGLKRKRPEEQSYLLGALETIRSFSTRAAERHAINARFETARLPRARTLLREIALCKDGEATTGALAARLGQYPQNVSTLLRQLHEQGLVDKVQRDGRSHEFKTTPIGRAVMDEIEPGWERVGLLFPDEPQSERRESPPTSGGHELVAEVLEALNAIEARHAEQLRQCEQRQAEALRELRCALEDSHSDVLLKFSELSKLAKAATTGAPTAQLSVGGTEALWPTNTGSVYSHAPHFAQKLTLTRPEQPKLTQQLMRTFETPQFAKEIG